MKTIKQCCIKLKLGIYREIACVCLDKAYEHMNDEVRFWEWMKRFRKYSNKYFELIQEVEL